MMTRCSYLLVGMRHLGRCGGAREEEAREGGVVVVVWCVGFRGDIAYRVSKQKLCDGRW